MTACISNRVLKSSNLANKEKSSNLAGVETLHHDAVLVQLVLRLHPLGLPLFPARRNVSFDGILQTSNGRIMPSEYSSKPLMHIASKMIRVLVAKRIRGNLLRGNVLSFENGEIWWRSCKLWRKFSSVFSCWQTHCLSQPSPILIFFKYGAFSKWMEIWIILSRM